MRDNRRKENTPGRGKCKLAPTPPCSPPFSQRTTSADTNPIAPGGHVDVSDRLDLLDVVLAAEGVKVGEDGVEHDDQLVRLQLVAHLRLEVLEAHHLAEHHRRVRVRLRARVCGCVCVRESACVCECVFVRACGLCTDCRGRAM